MTTDIEKIEQEAQTLRNAYVWSLLGRIADAARPAIARLVEPFARWYERQQLQAEMETMDDRVLAEIGITRADIPAVAEGTFGGHVDTPRGSYQGPRVVATGPGRKTHHQPPFIGSKAA